MLKLIVDKDNLNVMISLLSDEVLKNKQSDDFQTRAIKSSLNTIAMVLQRKSLSIAKPKKIKISLKYHDAWFYYLFLKTIYDTQTDIYTNYVIKKLVINLDQELTNKF
jgi:hypothetical protein